MFSESLQSNNEFSQIEKDVISTGYQKFLDDWGYLLDETQKEFVLREKLKSKKKMKLKKNKMKKLKRMNKKKFIELFI